MKKIAVFDFDGTITNKDSFIEFIKFAKGRGALFRGIILLSPILILYKLGIIKNSYAKQVVFSYFFKNMTLRRFDDFCERFARKIPTFCREKAILQIQEYVRDSVDVVIVSASIENWIVPWARQMGIQNVLSTQIEVSPDGQVTGLFLSDNCYGKEKVDRLLSAYPDIKNNRDLYNIIAYGDSKGDFDLLLFADEGYLNFFE